MKVILVFYRNLLVPSLVISVLIAVSIREGSVSIVMAAFWGKLVTSALLGLFFWFFRSDKFYFFENLGFTKRRLYAGAMAVDIIFWIVITGFVRLVS